ncbi:hypothetical protein CLU79DRAFT_842244 [Phycomyces nitens]|nr:hypothetical protein CLU79DRAFT_842244 [Phycomyces nitens]
MGEFKIENLEASIPSDTSSRNQAKQVIESKRARMGSVEKLANIRLISDKDRPKHVKQINLYDSAKTKKIHALSNQFPYSGLCTTRGHHLEDASESEEWFLLTAGR